MVESSITQTSPISPPPSPRDVVAAYLRLTVDSPDLKKARLHLSKRSVELSEVEVRAMPAGSTYTLGAEEADELGRRIHVSLKRPAADGGAAEEMTLPMIVVEEEGQWKIDLPATMERLMGGLAQAAEKMAGTVGEALTTAMSDVGKALAQSFDGTTSGPGPAQAPKAAKPAKKAAPKLKKKAGKPPKKAAQKAAKRPALKPGKAAAKPAKKAAKKPPKNAARKPARKAVKKTAVRTAARKRR